MKRTKDWDVDAFIDARREYCDVPSESTGQLRITVQESGDWTIRVSSDDQSFTLILMGNESASVPKVLHQTLSFLFGVAA